MRATNWNGKGHSGRIEVNGGLKVLAGLKATWAAVYSAAMKHDGIAAGAMFVEFSEGNPFVPFVDRAAKEYFEARAAYAAGGYVGLKMAA